ncbi:hypothetical protein [Streptomyces albidus (ex Kaewkla and Franco 2022)]|uniref:hypothetical protein n=1 Tax=Streptomyces albidus (ex Kaewkla and Franco 2022) TaxID=722709 RepID=UPI0015EECB7D|nr:hypothetical protein [Streptomyces albidus (ex Kaewkla and Franco 2022)]
MPRRTLALAAATAVLSVLAVSSAGAAGVTTSGTGWKIATKDHITALSPSQVQTVTFESDAIRKWYTPYLTRAVTQLRAAGVKISIGGVESVAAGKCPPRGHIWFREGYRPLAGRPGFSQAATCYDTRTTAQYSAIVTMNSEYRDGSWYLSQDNKHNIPSHELLHGLGLDHPNYDKDKDGTVENYECVATSYGNRPLACSPNGGYKTAANMGKLVGYDLNGIKALLANARAQGIK